MAVPVIECIPNFSEGRDALKIASIRDAITSVPGIALLASEADGDHHRAVITFAGSLTAVLDGAFEGVRLARDLIDLNVHGGVHPRMGAADVVPFVPLEGASMPECVQLAHELGRRVWEILQIPVYFYEFAALSAERRALESVRRGGFEHPVLAPDLGGPSLHPTAGACIIGARKPLIAFNVNLETCDVEIAKYIARKIRASSGGLQFVKAIGVCLRSRGIAQVSMNLTDFERTPLDRVYRAVEREAALMGTSILESELVGLIPREALNGINTTDLRLRDFSSSRVLETRLETAWKKAPLDHAD